MGAVVDIIESKGLRSELVEKVDVLDKVKGLMTLCGTSVATQEQVAEFYEVGLDAIKSVVRRHKAEIESSGAGLCKKDKVVNLLKCQADTLAKTIEIKPTMVKAIVTIGDETIDVSNRGLWLFSRRAILNIGMLLEESAVAEKVRKYLLDSEEKLEEEQREEIVSEITKEQKMMLDVLQAKDDNERILALSKLNNYQREGKEKYRVKVENLMNSDATFTIREAKNNLNVAEREFANYLVGKKYCYRQAYSGKLRPYAAYTKEPAKYFKEVKGVRKDNMASYTNTVITIDGIEHFRNSIDKIKGY